jgi:hypothetical protein
MYRKKQFISKFYYSFYVTLERYADNKKLSAPFFPLILLMNNFSQFMYPHPPPPCTPCIIHPVYTLIHVFVFTFFHLSFSMQNSSLKKNINRAPKAHALTKSKYILYVHWTVHSPKVYMFSYICKNANTN